MRWLLVSVALHAAVLWLLRPHHRAAPPVVSEEPPTEIVLVDPPAAELAAPAVAPAPRAPQPGGGGGHAGRTAREVSAQPAGGAPVHAGAWDDVVVGMEASDSGDGNGNGNGNRNRFGFGFGNANGRGNGIGFGDGGGIATRAAVPAPPAPPPPSKARPAKLLQPARDRDVEDDADLFVARVTVDTTGDVVAVDFVTTHPGVRGDQASSAIWSFRYAPALDDDGIPIASTFEQPFQVR